MEETKQNALLAGSSRLHTGSESTQPVDKEVWSIRWRWFHDQRWLHRPW